ncbi:amino acid permease [Corynebacterium uterequi]|uniref:Lysine:proton symporter, AAT family n=1 Tax=Corynebacterium uterequi TaxID=1072256 RepID=A0A0G3HEJ6_9CORY|nr:amino acid permease [Corynebacterium uterequi]AKK11125.1 lysine:proton symporter, AAT family [Corynebacterium uterequi]
MSHPTSAAPDQRVSAGDASSTAESRQLKRSLSTRHLTMIAVGGSIGTGLFVASGATISQAGPGGALLAYSLIGLMVWLVMQSLGELAAYLPLAGSFQEYGTRFVSPSFGFAIGWNYWFNWAITLAAELVAAALVMKFWFPDVPSIVWSALFLAVIFGLNALSARAYGEGEFWFASIKVVTVLVFVVLGVAMIAGILGGTSPGFENWIAGEAPFVDGSIGVLAVFIAAGYSFQGTELVGVAAGEAQDPGRTLPKAIRTIFWRILLFYIGAIAVIGFLIPYTDPNLLNSAEDNISVSPFTLVFERAGIAVAASVMNAVILTSVLSAGNSGLYASARMLYSMARNGLAPLYFTKLNSKRVPMRALVATTAIGAVGFITSLVGDGAAYTFLLTLSALAGFLTWMGISLCHLRFRRALDAQGVALESLPYRAPFGPWGSILALVMCFAVVLGQAYAPIVSGGNLWAILTPYLGIPVFVALWVGHRLVTKIPGHTPATADISRDDAAYES